MATYQYLGADTTELLSRLKLANMPDKIGPLKTTDIIGYSIIASVTLTSFIVFTRMRRKRKGKR